MKNEDLDITKPISVVSGDFNSNDNTLNDDNVSRKDKYKDALLKEELRELEEESEEALAEKNIAMAEALLALEINDDEINSCIENCVKNEPVNKKVKLTKKIKNKWDSLDKKNKILLILLMLLILILIIILTIFFVSKNVEKTIDKVVEEPEIIPVVVDNFYYKDGSLYFLNEEEQEIGSYECKNKDINLCYVAINKNRDNFDIPMLINEDGEEKNQRLSIYENNYVFVYDNSNETSNEIKLYSIIDKKEVANYLDVKAYNDNYLVVKDMEEKYGLIQINGEVNEVIKPQYEYLGMISDEDNLIAKNKKGYIVISKKNKVLSSAINSKFKIKSYNKNFVVVEDDSLYSVYDYKAKLLDGGYDFASVLEKYMILVDGKNLYVKDKELAKFNEEEVSLKNKDYIKTYIYDKDGKSIETKRSFEVNVKDSVIEVSIFNGVDVSYESLNILEASLNKNYEFVNYFDGKLYFYKDSEKKNLIGSYTCNNENYLSKDSKDYSSCFIANDTIFEDNDMNFDIGRKSRTPIINEKYAFISDGSNNIVLYDIVSKKDKSSYSKVNTYTENNDYKVVSRLGRVDVVALNKKGKYGMITIDGDTVSNTYVFDYNKLEKLGNYYIALDTNNKWKVLLSLGGSESVSIPDKILGYNDNVKYFKALSSNKYIVYNDQGIKVSEDKYLYVELYSDYYAGVSDSREVNIYDYNGNKLNDNTIKVGNYSFNKTLTPAFKVKKSGENFVVSVYDGNKYNETILTKYKVVEEQKTLDENDEEEEISEENSEVPGTPLE